MTEDNTVSPVVGVIILVAITVLLAAVIGAFVFVMDDGISKIETGNQLYPPSELEVRRNCDDRVVCFAHEHPFCFYNETYLLDKYCPKVNINQSP
jgi:flagellin-like protein